MTALVLTNHARKRWEERFAGRDLDAELGRAKRPSKKRINDLLRNIPQRYGQMVAEGAQFLISSEQSPPAVFVCVRDQCTANRYAVVTAYPLIKRPHTY